MTNKNYQLKLIVLKCILELTKVYINNNDNRIIKTLEFLYNNNEYYNENLVDIYDQFIKILQYNYQNTNYYLFNYVNFMKYIIKNYIYPNNKDKLNKLLEKVNENIIISYINYIYSYLSKNIININKFNKIKNNIIDNLFINDINQDKYIYN
jgi:hypothetical protein